MMSLFQMIVLSIFFAAISPADRKASQPHSSGIYTEPKGNTVHGLSNYHRSQTNRLQTVPFQVNCFQINFKGNTQFTTHFVGST